MKYMGSKRAMLRNGLGQILLREAMGRPRFVDLFSGSGSVAAFVASNVDVPVNAFDLQEYGCVLAGAVLRRTAEADHVRIWRNWRRRAARHLALTRLEAKGPPHIETCSVREIQAARLWCSEMCGPITRAYGGHYFSPTQALWLDSLRATVDEDEPMRTLALAALLDAASECAASPGHTAQPFQPTKTAKRFLHEAWSRDICQRTGDALGRLSKIFARQIGMASVADANDAANSVQKNDLVFVDPPYSALQYSRFYHVLESVVTGSPGVVEGVGRYPRSDLRPKSAYSVKSQAGAAIDHLLATLSKQGADVVLTFPDHLCSNGLSGALIRQISAKYFDVSEVAVKSRFSTLGGSGKDCIASEKRGARRDTSELILVLRSA